MTSVRFRCLDGRLAETRRPGPPGRPDDRRGNLAEAERTLTREVHCGHVGRVWHVAARIRVVDGAGLGFCAYRDAYARNGSDSS